MNIGDMIDEEFEDASDEADNEYQFLNEPSGPPSTSNSCTSSPPVNNNSNSNNEEPPASSPQRSFYTSMLSQSGNTLVFSNSGKPYGGAKRGPGRPRKDFLPGNRIVKDGRIIFKKVRAGNIHKFPMKRKPAVSKDEKITSNSGVFGLHHENSTGESNSSGLYSSKSPSSENLPLNANENGTVEGSNSNSGDKTPLQTPEELPYFPERWPGKVCALCNLGERSQLGQGEMLRLEISETDQQILVERSSDEDKEAILNDVSPSSGSFPQISNRRQKGLSKCKNPVITSEYVDELDKIGYTDAMDFASIQESPYYYVHRLCATWSFGVLREPSGALDKIASVIFQSLKRKCSYCNHYGASVACKMSCPKFFHFPCVAASGGFQIIQNFTSFCKEHINQVPLICNTDDINCRSCSSLGDVTNLVMCLVCGDHYHGTCIGLPQLPGVRAGWQCNSCRKCQICRVPDINEGRSLSCEQCHKVFHANCLRPVMSSIPKYGWKCRRCRVCSDCGSRTPGAGASSRWHAHYTVCDSCYQQRNKGFSCPICHRAYRAAAYREMVKCSWCNKFVHSTCDSEADLSVYHEKKQNNPDYDYICPPCKTLIQSGRLSTTAGSSLNRNSNYDEDNISVSQDSNFAEEGDGNTGNSAAGIETFEKNSDYGLGKGKPYLAIKVAAKKRMGGLSFSGNIGGGSGIGVGAVGGGRGKGNKVPFQKRIRLSEFGRKRGPKTKIRGVFGIPGLELQRPSGSGTGGNGDASATSNNKDDEPGIENRLVLCSAKDKFILTQDICVMCGAIGTDYEGCLISCTQCGQCYHPYCVNVKVTKIILQKGWRCLDCTVCEGCGQKNDEARLILCDECDISYHIYCMEPPLDYVPQGNWKCKWCAICHKCGKNTPGKNCQWKNNYIECGPCSSQTLCAFCSEQYQEGELIIQCHQCERWLHCKCDSIKNEDEAQKCDNMGYNCILCRPKDQLPPHLLFAQLQQQQGRKTLLNSSSNNSSTSAVANRSGNTPKHQQDDIINDTSSTSISLAAAGLEGSHYVDGICLSENGLNMIKSLQMEYIRRKRKQKFSNNDCISSSGNNKDAGILAAIESVVAGSFSNNEMISDDIMKVVEPLDPKEEAEIYKDGMVWERADASPPEGFALFTNEQGIVVLRKKRQRNLQKLGIGGFNVRNRASFKKDGGSAIFKDASDIAITCDGESGDTGNSGLCFSESYPPSSEKKRKPLRKKQKSKLTETYPSYLQEAFFGKSLLDTSKTNFESDTSEDETKSNVSDDKCIKLSQEELQILDQIKTERQKSLLRQQQQKASSPGITMTQQQLITVGNSDLSDIITTTTASEIMPAPAAVTTTITTPITTTTTALPIAVTAAAVQIQKEQQQLVPSTKPLYNDIKIGGNYTNNLSNVSTGLEGTATPSLVSTAAIAAVESASTQGNSFSTETTSMSAFTPNQLSDDSDAFKDIISNDLLDSDLVNSIINDGDDLSKNSGSLDISCDDTKLLSKKNDLTDILSPHFSLESIGIDSKDVDDIFQDVIDTENKSVQTANHNKPSETPPLSTTSSSMGFAKAGEIAGASLSPTNTFISIHQQQPQQHQFSTSTNTINKAQTMHQTIAATVIASNSNNTFVVSRQNTNSSTLLPTNSIRSVQSVWQQQPQQSNVQNLQQQSNTNIQSVVTTVQQQQQQMNCAQKSSERMRRDEELGEMATISAVLYANTNHPELKQDYPNWNDRCKQIYKRWRALSNEKKAPFLQQARDNRSSLRMRKGQQDQEKITTQQKTLKEQEQERQWKQLQAMRAKEQQMQHFNTPMGRDMISSGSSGGSVSSFMDNSIIGGVNEKHSIGLHPTMPGTPRPQFNTDIVQPTVYATSLDKFHTSVNSFNSLLSDNITSNSISTKHQENNKQLRDLLQRQGNNELVECTENGLTSRSSQINKTVAVGGQRWMSETMDTIGNSSAGHHDTMNFNTNTFREPFPVMTTSQQNKNQKLQSISPTNNQNQQPQQQQQTQLISTSHQNPNSPAISIPPSSPSPQILSSTTGRINFEQQQQQRIKRVTVRPIGQTSVITNEMKPNISNVASGGDDRTTDISTAATTIVTNAAVNRQLKIKDDTKTTDGTEIPESVTSDLEKLEQDDNNAIGEVEGVGDILGGLGEDDDDELLNSLTAEMGADFNILEYADPELDALTDSDNHNLFDKLDLDEGDHEDRMKKLSTENKISNIQQRFEIIEKNTQQSSILLNQMVVNQNEVLVRRTEGNTSTEMDQERRSLMKTTGMNLQSINPSSTSNIEGAKIQQTNLFRVGNLPRYCNIVTKPNICKITRPNLPPPPPPYPGPPPPYPSGAVIKSTIATTTRSPKEQPLLLEDLLEQEKREQQQQKLSTIVDNKLSYISNVSGVGGGNTSLPHTKSLVTTNNSKIGVSTPVYNVNLHPPPALPPDNIITEQDRIQQITYEQWLSNQNVALNNQQKFYEDEVAKLRKIRKSLNSKQRLMKKNGSELSTQDALELSKISSEQAVLQKQLEIARKQSRQHALLVQEYKSKHLAKLQMSSSNINSPGKMTPVSPLLSPSTGSQGPPSALMQSSSPLSNHMLQSTRSPLQSPSPLLSHSPGGINQSPIHQPSSNVSPYHTMQSSPRISTPHSLCDENSFSPSAISSSSPLTGRRTSPSPRITSPQQQQRVSSSVTTVTGNNQMTTVRISNSPGHNFANGGHITTTSSNQVQQKFINLNIGSGQDKGRLTVHLQQQLQDNTQQSLLTSANTFSQQQQQQQLQTSESIQQQAHRTTTSMQFLQQQHRQQVVQQRQQGCQTAATSQMLIKQQQQQQRIQSPASLIHSQNSNIATSTFNFNIQQHQFGNRNRVATNIDNNSPLIDNYILLGNTVQQQHRDNTLNSSVSTSTTVVAAADIQKYLGNSQQDQQGSGGGSNNNAHLFPFDGSLLLRNGKIKLGLFGGSPMWNISNLNQKFRNENQIVSRKDKQNSSSETRSEGSNKMIASSSNSSSSSLSSLSKSSSGSIGLMNDIVVVDSSPDEKSQRNHHSLIEFDDYQDNKSFVGAEVSLNSAAQNLTDGDDITVIESFASASASASELCADIISSPLDSEVAEEYVLFSSDVVNYDDSNDSIKTTSLPCSKPPSSVLSTGPDDLKLMKIDCSKDYTDSLSSSPLSSSAKRSTDELLDVLQHESIIATTNSITPTSMESIIATTSAIEKQQQENVTIMTTSTNKELSLSSSSIEKGKSSTSDNQIIIAASVALPVNTTSTVTAGGTTTSAIGTVSAVVTVPRRTISPKTIISNSNFVTTNLLTCNRIPFTSVEMLTAAAANIQTTSSSSTSHSVTVGHATPSTVVVTPKKIVTASGNDVTQTAKVSIGNTTISVPLLKTMTLNSSHIISNSGTGPNSSVCSIGEKQNKVVSSSVSITKQPTILNVRGQKINPGTIVSLSPIQIKPSTVTSNKIVQAAVVGKKIQLPSSQSSSQSTASLETVTSLKPNLIHTYSYPKLSSLTVLQQDISLPNKIFEDESASPDSSLEQDDSDIKETSSSSITTTATISNTISTTVVSKTSNTMTAPTLRKAIESCSSKISDKVSSDDKLIEKSGEPPKKVLIIAATEDKKNEEQHQKNSSSFIKTDTTSSTEQKLTEAQTAVTVARSISIMPQLSPLSKPTEMTTNLANVSQQLRTIMSSIHNSSLTSTSQTSSAAAATEVKKSIITELDDPDGTRNNSKELFHNTSKTVLNRSAANEEQKSSSLSDKKTANIATISNSNTLTVFLTTTNASIAPVQKSIELGQQKQKSINTSNSTTTMTPTSTNTIFSSVAQQQSNISTLTSATSSGLSNTSNKSTSTTFSASVISVDNNKRNLLISSPLSSSNQFSLHLKRSKSTDDGGVDRGETPAQITGTKRYSLEVTPLKLESSEDFVHGIGTSSNVATSSTSITTGVIPRSTMDSSTITTTTSSSIGCKTSNLIIGQQVTKPDETQNVLLKKLLQNSGGTPSSGASSANSNSGGVVSLPSGQSSIPLRKVAAVRAPSLGVVSSLEAQLARPVIPPVPASPSSAMLQQATQPAAMKIQSVLQESASTSKINTSTPDDDTTKKSSTQLISRETSFVSSPVVVMNTTMKQQQQQQHETSGGYVNDKQRSSFEKNTVSSTGAFIEVKREKSPPSLSMKLNFTQKINELKRSESLSSHQSSPQSAPLIEKTSSEESSFKMMFCDETTKSLNRQDSMEIPCTPTSRTSTLSGELGDEIESLGGKDEKLLMKSLSSSNNTTTTDSGGVGTGSNYDINAELKKKRKREYQKNRRQMLNKDALHSNAGGGSNSSGGSSSNNKKRSRKLSKLDEDYDNFIDNLMSQLRQMPPLQVLEPLLSRNYSICPPYGAGDLSKFGNKENNSTTNLSSMGTEINNNSNQIKGTYGNIEIDNIFDFYNTKPFGNLEPVPEIDPTPPHNGFYDQEFPPIKFDTDYDSNTRFDIIFKDRDIDTPESIVTSSSPECVQQMTYDGKDHNYHPHYGLKMMKDDYEDDNNCCYDRMSPIVPVVVPTPIKLKVGIDLSLDKKQTLSLSNINDTNQKENLISGGAGDWKNRVGSQNSIMQANDSNVTVTLTLTSSAAEDILGVLRDLANILHIPPPSSYQIVERTTTPTSHKLGLYRTKRKDGKEGDPIDIQTILNGAAKFCRHCDVVILNTIIRAKASEFPLLSNNELINDDDDLYFCSKSCYKQFKWRPTNIIDDDTIMIDKDTKQQQTSSFSNDFNGTKPIFNSNDNNDNHMKKIKQEDFGDDFITGDGDNDLVKFSTNGNKNALKKCVNDLLNSDIGSNGSGGGIKSEISSSPTTTTTAASVVEQHPPKICRYKYYTTNSFNSLVKYKKPSDKEITDMLFRMNITVAPSNKMPDDTRQCIFCNQIGDGVADGPSRLLNFDVDKWVHLNCALWSDGVYETVNGALMNLETALQASLNQTCTLCHQLGATIKCFKNRCINIYHLTCAVKDRCVFYKNKTTHCYTHAPKTEKENELTTLSVQRRVYVERDESRQVAAVMHHSELSNLLRVGSLTFLNVGQLLPHQLQAFHTTNHIYPIGYKIIRFYWSMRRPNKRCRYICSIADVSGRPEFRILVQEPSEEDLELRDITPKAVWQRILEPLATLRKNCDLVQLFPKYVTGEDLFGLTEPAVVRILESLPGIETLTDYRFKYGRNPLLELPLAINPSGAARTEPKQKQAVGWRKSHTQRSGSTNQRLPLAPTTSVAGEVACPYSKQFVHSKSSQYKKMKQEWRNNVYLARSKIQGLGLYAARDLEKHTMVIEYIGEIIRTEVSEIREKQYEARNRGIYMFRLDEDRVIDATLCGGLARYINHSCNPNCVTEIVEVDREYRIIIFAKRRINRGEELSYDYKFDIEDDAHKISCMCGAPNCRKWMN